MFNVVNFFLSELLNIIIIIFFILIGGILPLFERKFLSLTQRRVGPKYVGYKGRLQFIADSLKVLLKDYMVLYNTNGFFFFLIPVLFFNVNLIIYLNIL
jgi:NADH-quinone oxidoreductase subunit H